MIRQRVLYQGHVQGVGFRYETCRIAARFDVGGSVKNLPDGQVEVIVEGTAKEVKAFLDELADTMQSYIRKIAPCNEAPTGQFDSFSVCY